jgi:Tfp pilus assembly major pilin PilA
MEHKQTSPTNKTQRHRIELMIIALIVTVLANIGIFYWNKTYYAETTAQIEEQKQISVLHTIYFSSEDAIEEKKQVPEGATALDLLKQTTNLVVQGEGELAFVTQIGSRKADDSKKEFWAFYVNGKQAETGAGSYQLQQGDHIEWKIETYE